MRQWVGRPHAYKRPQWWEWWTVKSINSYNCTVSADRAGAVSGLDITRDHHAPPATAGITKHLIFFDSLNVSLYPPPHPSQQDSQATQAHTQHQTNKQTFSENNENIFNRPENMFYCPWQPFSCDWHLMLGNGSNSSLALGSMPMVPVP